MEGGAWQAGYSPWGHKESDRAKHVHACVRARTHTHTHTVHSRSRESQPEHKI